MMDQKAMLDDLFDFLFLIIVGFFAFLFVQGMLQSGIEAKENEAQKIAQEVEAEQQSINFWQQKVSYLNQEMSVADLLHYCLQTKSLNALEMESLISPALLASFPHLEKCHRSFLVYEQGVLTSCSFVKQVPQVDYEKCVKHTFEFHSGTYVVKVSVGGI